MNEPLIREAMFADHQAPRLPGLPQGISQSRKKLTGESIWLQAIRQVMLPRPS